MNQNQNQEPDYWLDMPSTLRLIIVSLVLVCIALVAADFLYHKHGHFDFELWPGFYAWYGFLSYCLIVLSAKQLRKFIGRKEQYYESTDSDTNNEPDNNESANNVNSHDQS